MDCRPDRTAHLLEPDQIPNLDNAMGWIPLTPNPALDLLLPGQDPQEIGSMKDGQMMPHVGDSRRG
jgi:hypothetical protein